MRSLRVLLVITIVNLLIMSSAMALSLERQREIIENYMYVTGQLDERPDEALIDDSGEPVPIKCGMSAIADFRLNRDKLDDGLMKSLGVQIPERPQYGFQNEDELTYNTPGGFFKIHYTITGSDSVYHPNEDNFPANGIPDYVDSVAWVCDSVYDHIINTLGYPVPPLDGFYTDGDDHYDVYLTDLPGGVYGQTWMDSMQIDGPGTLRATSFVELDNDYQSLQAYKDRPMDAIRVTMAHEFFHTVQFGIDFSEAELYISGIGANADTIVARYWMELSAVWMEEEIYDEINDFYLYLPWFFDDPRGSIQQVNSYGDPHPYASAIWAMYLSETYGRDIIKDIWLRCGTMGPYANFLKAAHNAILSASGNTAGWASAFRDFALWNHFTGPRAQFAPSGVGYFERENFPAFPDSLLAIYNSFDPPIFVFGNKNPLAPRHNSAAYMTFRNTELVAGLDTTYYLCDMYYCVDSEQVINPITTKEYDWSIIVDTALCLSSYWRCVEDEGSVCYDSSRVRDPLDEYDFIHLDTVMDVWLALNDGQCQVGGTFPLPWGLSVVYQMKHDTTIYEIDSLLLPDDSTIHFGVAHPDSFLSVTIILSPATYDSSFFRPFNPTHFIKLGYWVEAEPVDTNTANRPTSMLLPYPNPAIVNQMTDRGLMFRFQVGTDSLGAVVIDTLTAHLEIDLYNVAGERVRTLSGYTYTGNPPQYGLWEIEWDMKNQAGNDVASGVYVAYARLYSSDTRKVQLAEEFTKVVVIR